MCLSHNDFHQNIGLPPNPPQAGGCCLTGAIKKLIRYAFDADATRIAITTNWPSFDIITCSHDGCGMTQRKFKKFMTKDFHPQPPQPSLTREDWRESILAAGMLGFAQISHNFQFISNHEKTQTAFSASISNIYSEEFLFAIESIDYKPNRVRTFVIASDMRSAFIRKFRGSLYETNALPSRFSAFLKEIHNTRAGSNLEGLGDYWELVWELAISCPVAYPKNFQVVIDGLLLRNPMED